MASTTAVATMNGEEDPEKKAKKAAKEAAKAAKKAKFDAKKSTAAAKPAGNENSKKAQAKAEAEAKKAKEAEELKSLVDAVHATPKGQKKDVTVEMPKGYSPHFVEAAWYSWWETCGFFKPDLESDKPPFVVVIPPPNVTGALHIGHALTDSIQDTVIRYKRMRGYNTLWVPGTDHAGIATQTVVEKKIAREQGLTRHQIGREGFLQEVYKYVDDYGGRILNQLRRMGTSVDWERLVFTMDEARCAAVQEAFIRLHRQRLIYRDNRLVNWDCRLRTAVSDIEVDYIDVPGRTLLAVPGYDEPVEFGVIISFAYPVEDSEEEIVVATTRVETMLGDTAVAVHPDDPRYKHLHGKHAMHPVDGRRIPIITDAELVDMSFGTGAVKITPAHDPNDFATGKRHNLQFINILDDTGSINGHGGPFAGQPRFQARKTVVKFLESKGLYRGKKDNEMRLGLCSRSKDVIEPVLKPQWWVDCKQMAADACQAVRDGRLEIIPTDFESTWFRWLENIRDWCISRQLWWGHRIPAFYVSLEGQEGAAGGPSEHMDRWVVGNDEEEAAKEAEKAFPGQQFTLKQDEDVLDTWFSSGLFPFSVHRWPQGTRDLQRFYPTQLLETGHDILFFWVARMVMLGMQLTGEVPFKQVYLHSMVRDAHGRKMSKSLGNVIDPLHVIEGISLQGLHETLEGGNLPPAEVEKAKAGQQADFPDGIEECGTDALRFALVAYTSQARDINLDIKRVVAYRYWCNKLWNAIKFAMKNLGEDFVPSMNVEAASLSFACRWILSRLNAAVETITAALDVYDFSSATQALYAFWQYEVCDVFIELTKPVMALEDSDPAAASQKLGTRETLWLCLDAGLRLLHPFMPFVTEELWQRLPRRQDQRDYPSIMISPYPEPHPSWKDSQAEADMEYVSAAVSRIRSLRADYGLTKEKPKLFVSVSQAGKAAVLHAAALEIATLSVASSVELLQEGEAAPVGCGVAIVDDVTTVYMLLSDILDAGKEVEKLTKKEQEVVGRIEALKQRMGVAGYADKTPEKVRLEDADKLSKAEAELETTLHHIKDMMQLLAV